MRADVKLALMQWDVDGPAAGPEPDDPRAAGDRARTSCATATRCQSIAYAAYGDPTRWRAIAEANGIDDPLRLRRGTALTIPRLDA